MAKRFLACLAAALLTCSGLFAQEAAGGGAGSGEEEFFGSAPVEAGQGAAENKNLQQEIEKERVGLSGILQAQGFYTLTRDFVRGLAGIEVNPINAVIQGDFLVDVRLKKSFRAFLDLSVGYLTSGTPLVHNFMEISPAPAQLVLVESQNTLIGIKEVFVDFNIANTVYFRAGKQVLQWGTGFFWNPTDLINIEHKSFVNLDALLEGVFGLRSDVVFSRAFHLYTFLNVNNAANLYDVAFAARTEFLVGTVEFGLSGWINGKQIPVFGFDLSAGLPWRLNLTAEGTLSWGDIRDKMNPGGTTYSIRDQLVPKVDVGLSRSFDAWNVQDRITVSAEFFYNYAGYDVNMFELLDTTNLATFMSGFYQTGYYGQYNAALFITISKFILSDMNLTLSGLGNFSDFSGIAMLTLDYTPVNNFILTLQLGAFLGPDKAEYTVSYNPASATPLTSNQLFAILGAKVNF